MFVFIGMIILSYVFSRNIVRAHLIENTENVLTFGQAKLEADLREPRTTLDFISEMLRDMIIGGGSIGELQEYFNKLAGYAVKETDSNPDSSFNGFYGYFETFGDEPVFIDSLNRALPDDFSPRTLPWYQAAVLAGNRIAVTYPYLNSDTGEISFAYTRRIYDDAGLPLGIVCLDVRINDTLEYIVETAIAQGGYGLLLSQDLTIIAHPNKEFVGLNAANPLLAFSEFIDELRAGQDIYERQMDSHLGESSVAFFRRLPNGFYIGLVTPKDPYYQSVRTMTGVLTALLAAGLIFILTVMIRIDTAKEKSDMESVHKSAFLARMSHEIRTPMNAILGISEIQLQDKKLSPDTEEAFRQIYHSGNLLLNIINDILDFSKVEAGKLEIVSAKYDIPSLLNDTVQLNLLRYESKPLEFKLNLDENMPLELYGDELRIKQILNNLLSNAFKYTDKGEIILSVYAEPLVREQPVNAKQGKDEVTALLVFRVSDTGQGMSEDQVARLFDEYSRFNMEKNRGITGTGLGMSIVKRLVDMMGGGIFVESKLGEGSTFTVRIPQKNIGSAACGAELADSLRNFRFRGTPVSKKAQIIREYMPYGSVLVVDDVASNLYVAKGLLAPYGLRIETVVSGTDAIEKIKAGSVYDIVFMDHMMPGMDGMEATKIMRVMGYTSPIVALTANAVAGQLEIFLANGFDGFISKPIDSRGLDAALKHFIRDKQPREVIEAARQEQHKMETEKSAMAGSANSSPEIDTCEIYKFFVLDGESAVKVMEDSCAKLPNDKAFYSYTVAVHGMKNVLANIGEAALSSAALKLEQAGKENDLGVITEETPAFLDALRLLIDKHKPAGDDGTVEISGEDNIYLRDKLSEIKTACEKFDVAVAKDALDSLRQRTWPRYVNETLDEISVHLLHSAFKKAAQKAEITVKN